MNLLLVAAGAAVLAALAGAVLPRWADVWGLSDVADPAEDRRSHRGPLPRVGGLAVAVGFFGAAAVAGGLQGSVLLAPLALFIGLHDDLRDTDARARLVAIVALAFGAWAMGPAVEAVRFGDAVVSAPGGPLVTVLWIVGVVVAFDFLDGLDGLAGGVAVLAAVAWTSYAVFVGDPSRGPGAAALGGALVGFLVHNRHPARIQLGDHGSNLVGFLVAVTALDAGGGASPAGHPMVAAGLVLGVPILDAGGTVVRRLRGGSGLFRSERGHLHHRLLDRGFGHAGAVHRLWAATVVGVVAAAATLRGGLWAGAGLGLAVVAAVVLLHRARHAREDEDRAGRAGAAHVES